MKLFKSMAIRATALLLFFAMIGAVILWQVGVYDISFITRPPVVTTEGTSPGTTNAPEVTTKPFEGTLPTDDEEEMQKILDAIRTLSDLEKAGYELSYDVFSSNSVLAKANAPYLDGEFSLRLQNVTKNVFYIKENGRPEMKVQSDLKALPRIQFYYGYAFVDNGSSYTIFAPDGRQLRTNFSGTLVYARSEDGYPVVKENGKFYQIDPENGLTLIFERQIKYKALAFDQPRYYGVSDIELFPFSTEVEVYTYIGDVTTESSSSSPGTTQGNGTSKTEPESTEPNGTSSQTPPPSSKPNESSSSESAPVGSSSPAVGSSGNLPPESSPDITSSERSPAESDPEISSSHTPPSESIPNETSPNESRAENDKAVRARTVDGRTAVSGASESGISNETVSSPEDDRPDETSKTEPSDPDPTPSVSSEPTVPDSSSSDEPSKPDSSEPDSSVPDSSIPASSEPDTSKPDSSSPVSSSKPDETTPESTTKPTPSTSENPPSSTEKPTPVNGTVIIDGKYYKVTYETLYGYKDKDGNVVIEPKFAMAYDFTPSGFAAVSDGKGNVFFINKNGTEVITLRMNYYTYPAEFNNNKLHQRYTDGINMNIEDIGMYYYDNGFVMMRYALLDAYTAKTLYKSQNILINSTGQIVPMPGNYVLEKYSDGVMMLSKGGMYGYMKNDMSWVCPAIFSKAEPFIQGLAVAELNGKYGMIDREGNTVLPFCFKYISNVSDGKIAAYSDELGWQIYVVMAKTQN